MFNNTAEDEHDFCESYKSQILGTKEDEKEKSLFSTIVKLLTILILLISIVGISFYGYNYFMSSEKLKNIALPPVSMQVSDEDLVVQMEEPVILENKASEKVDVIKKVEVKEKEHIAIPLIVSPQSEEEEIDKIANEVKISIAQSELKEENESKIEEVIVKENIVEESIIEKVKKTKPEKSLEVPTSAPEAQYLEQLADLSKEIDKEKN